MLNWEHIFKIIKLFIASTFISLALSVTAHSTEKIKALATFSILGDMAKQIGGEHVLVKTLVGPDGDTHVYQPTPAAAKSMSEAALLIVNGLGFEGWLDRLVKASGFNGRRVVATKGMDVIAYKEGEGHDDHAKHEKHDDHAKHEKHDDHAKHEKHERSAR